MIAIDLALATGPVATRELSVQYMERLVTVLLHVTIRLMNNTDLNLPR